MTKSCPKGFSVCFCNPDRPICKRDTHKMPNGDIHTGKTHTKNSKLVKKAKKLGGISGGFMNDNKKFGKSEKLNIKSKNNDELSFGKKKDKSNWEFGKKQKDMLKPNLRLKAKVDLVRDYLDKKKISATVYNKFMEHLHHHTKAHIKSMLVQIHRKKKSFDDSHKIAMAKFGK